MKNNRLTITINKPVGEVFAFVLDPKNTPRWIKTITEEETNDWPVQVGTKYRNRNVSGKWNEYVVSALEEDKSFEFTTKDGNYHVRYSFSESNGATQLEYYEWVERGDLEGPFTQEVLEKLKRVVEADTHPFKE